jgi:DNA end-binding protein Ku
VVLHGKEELVLLRPLDGVLTMTMLHYKSQVRSPKVLDEYVPKVKTKPQELKLAQQLIDASTSDDFDFSKYEDTHTSHLKQLIDAKVAGKEIVAPPAAEEETHVINLMDALKKSVQQTKKPAGAKAKEARKSLAGQLARTQTSRTGTQRRRKTS